MTKNDKKVTASLNVRLTDEEYYFLVALSEALGENVSACVRRIIDDYIATVAAIIIESKKLEQEHNSETSL